MQNARYIFKAQQFCLLLDQTPPALQNTNHLISVDIKGLSGNSSDDGVQSGTISSTC